MKRAAHPMPYLYHSLVRLFFLFLTQGFLAICRSSSVYAEGCYPTDPSGNNPQNPCIQYPPPGIRSDTFVSGQARPVRSIPTINNPGGRILINPRGYWTGSQTSGSTRIIKVNTGRTFSLNNN
jgi:hypothetical protein